MVAIIGTLHISVFSVSMENGNKEGVVWQAADIKIFLTWIKSGGGQTKLLANRGDAILGALTFIALWIQYLGQIR